MHPVVDFRKRVFFRQNEIKRLFEESISKYAGVTAHAVMTIWTLAHDPRKKENTESTLAGPRWFGESVEPYLAVLKVLQILYDYVERMSAWLIEPLLIRSLLLHVQDV